MQFGLSESQQILKRSAREFFTAECPITEVRRLMETDTAYDPALWQKMADQGFTGIVFAEEQGGMSLGKVELALLMEEMGRAIVPGPFFSTIAAGIVVDATGSADQKRRLLGPICEGKARAALAVVEHTRVTATDEALTGEFVFVADAAAADWIVAKVGNDAWVIAADATGASIRPMPAMDLTRKIYAVQLSNAPAERLANAQGLSRALECVTAALAAEMVGGMQRALDTAVEYAKTRKQFGQPIGKFQAVQHACADSYLETESARSAAYYAAWALEENAPDASVAVSIAKMYASDGARNVGNRGIQVHGGMGFTWENDLHLFYRRFKASETAFGDATAHRERIASLVIDAGQPASAAGA